MYYPFYFGVMFVNCVWLMSPGHWNPEGMERFRGLKNLCKKPTNLSTFFATVTNLQGMSFFCFFVKQSPTFQEEEILENIEKFIL